jgi:hypothetical protein
MSGPFGSSQWMYSSGEAAEGQSLRFNDNDSAYLNWTPASAGNRKTWTLSFWMKRSNLNSSETYPCAIKFNNGTNRQFIFALTSNDEIGLDFITGGSYDGDMKTVAVFRDPSAWYHIVLTVDTTQSTSTDRVKLWVNNQLQTMQAYNTSLTYPSQNYDTAWNDAYNHWIGRNESGGYFDGYMAEVNFVDGLALNPTSFAQTDDNGQWVPKKNPNVTYGTNGFYLPFTNDYEVEGFNTVTYTGDGGTQYVGGVGFEPDFLWIKRREGAENHILQDSVRGAARQLFTNTTEAELSGANNVQSFETDGFVVGTDSGSNGSGRSFVAWAWDAGTGSAASNTDGSITSSVKANPDYGFSIVSYTGTGTTSQETIGVGLDWSGKDKLVITKNRDNSTDNWGVNSSVLGSNKVLSLNTTNNDSQENSSHYITYETNGFRTYNGGTGILNKSGNKYIAYCFHSVAGYSDFGSYTGTGSSGNTITLGFEPAFLIIKNADSAASWTMWDNTRSPNAPQQQMLRANNSNAEETKTDREPSFTSTGFTIGDSDADTNASGDTYIYIAFADKREAAFWLDQSGNNNDWTNNNMQESDISLDNPTNNFSVLNPIDPHGGNASTLSEGNLKASSEGSNSWSRSTYWIESGAYYCEFLSQSSSGQLAIQGNYGNTYFSWTDNGQMVINGVSVGTYSSFTYGDIIGLAIDRDANTVKFYKNNTLAYTGTSLSSGDIKVGQFFAPSTGSIIANFGQDSSFAGNKTAQGNQDENGLGDFYYEPPAGYLALCSQNLPDPAITDGSEYFNTVLYTGAGAGTDITGVGFQPDILWIKSRDIVKEAGIVDAVRGGGVGLYTGATNAEESGKSITFNSDGADLGASWSNVNTSGASYVAWNWKANGSGSSNTDGSITSTVSANTTAGVSVVGYTGNGTAGATVGHGLSSAPEMVIVKERSNVNGWYVYHEDLGASNCVYLDSTSASVSVPIWNSTAPSSSVVTFSGGAEVNRSSGTYIAYCFHSVEGYSKFGSYTGNGSTDGPFVYTGFRPAWVMVKATGTASNWFIWDVQRNTYNAATTPLFPNSNSAEEATLYPIDVLSNGFKLRASSGYGTNESAAYIYMAFAENPFKYSNAR